MPIRIPIDWGDLTMAFDTADREVAWYLDVQTGECVMIAAALGLEEDEELMERIEGDEEGRYREVPTVESHEGFDRMVAFARTVEKPEARAALEDALDRPRPFRRFKDAAGALGLLDAWHVAHERGILEDILAWLRHEGVEPTNLPAELAGAADD